MSGYTVKSIIKEAKVFVATIKVGDEVKKFAYSRDLSEEELQEAVEKDAQGILADLKMFAENAERDAREAEDDRKVESVKEALEVE